MGASDPAEDSANDRTRPVSPDEAGGAGGADRVDVVWYPDDDDYIVVAAGDGDRAVRFHHIGRYGVAAIGVGLSALGVVVLHGFLTATTSLAWPTSGIGFALASVLVAAYAWWRYDPDRPPEVVARDVSVDAASEDYDFEE